MLTGHAVKNFLCLVERDLLPTQNPSTNVFYAWCGYVSFESDYKLIDLLLRCRREQSGHISTHEHRLTSTEACLSLLEEPNIPAIFLIFISDTAAKTSALVNIQVTSKDDYWAYTIQ